MILLFEKAAISATSVVASNSGTNVDFWMIPAGNLITISATQATVVLYFREGNLYNSTLATGEALTGSFKYATVTLTVTSTKESEVAENFYKLILAGPKPIVPVPSTTNILKFSNVTSEFEGIEHIISVGPIIRYDDYDTMSSSGIGTTIDVLSSTDAVLGTLDASVPDTVKLMSAILSYSKVGDQGQITSSAASPSGIAYQNSRPMSAISYSANDSVDSFTDGDYDHTNPVYPVSYAKVDYNATQADVRVTPATGTLSTDIVGQTMLEENNAFGNKFRYTDDAGNPSDAAVGSNLWAHVDWNNHSWTGATNYYVIDHLQNWGMTVKYADDSGTVNLNGSNDWAAWLTYISTVTWEGTYSGFIPLDMGDVSNAHGAKCSPNEVWADEFFEFDASVSGSSRGAFLTGESYDASNFYPIYDSGNPDLVIEITKSIASGFQSRLTNVFMKRKHY